MGRDHDAFRYALSKLEAAKERGDDEEADRWRHMSWSKILREHDKYRMKQEVV